MIEETGPTFPSALRGRPLFSFVVVADTHVNESDGVSSSPYETNRLANARARRVFLDIAAMDPPPSFVVHLGDIVHPVPSLPTFDEAVRCFKDIAAPVKVPVHLAPGNHDVGDKRVDWMPADQVCESFLKTYRAAFGADYHAFDEGGLRFIVINSLLLNSGLPDEERQKLWLEDEIERAADKRVFLFMHYPPYIHSRSERGNYDNVDEPGRSWLLGLMQRPQVEAVFAGHVHNFWYERVGNAEFYMLPSTAFLRHDFSEFYKVAPSVEFGRGDVEKLGYFVVDVHADGHVAHSIRTMGAQAKAGDATLARHERLLAHPKTSTFDNVGVELRHPWAESMQITATGGVQEFGRKWARNDYPLLALWEMGARLLKVPDMDLGETESRQRMQVLARQGHRYIVTALGAPKAELLAHDLQACGVAAFEVNATLDGFARQRSALRALRTSSGAQVYYAKILTFDDSHFDGKHFSHFVKAGFTPEELAEHEEMILSAHRAGEIDGVTVRIEAGQSLVAAAATLKAFHAATGCLVLASLKLSGPSLAIERADDRANVASVAEAMILSKSSPGIRYVYDTFMDVDRGYFPRHAFIDRRFNPRPAATAFTTLNALLSSAQTLTLGAQTHDASLALAFKADAQDYVLIRQTTSRVLDRLGTLAPSGIAYDLVTGERCSVASQMKTLQRALDGEGDGPLQVVLVRL
ncbi:Calcineurin-like phosphoesterase [Variovorax sp. SRS16]|uniref:metallophosphoesterase family protein n=1 Tax=Variovorax sp. SRS16 TaxID=282217 RepID=UPI001315D76E|nr:metallophosphoesterase [Variovorax sp. SRS16]VTU17803.1 Calcineurin-like phosphoesterase [Variovorax sp. SRS16]